MQPRWPFCRSYLGNRFASRPPVFYSVTEPLPWVLALLMGFQHAVAMVGGIIVPPIIISSTQTDPTIRSCEPAWPLNSTLKIRIKI